MPTTIPRLALLALGSSLILSACAGTPNRGTGTAPAGVHPEAATAASTGIDSCDAYLSSYLACHRSAQIYPSDQLDSRYQAMRDSLQQQAQDPAIRPQLGERCRLLSTQLQTALAGKSCNN